MLDLREQHWGPQLRAVSLVAEAEIRSELTAQAANALGFLYGRLADRHTSGTRFLLRWPACVAAVMVGAAVSGYEAGTYWPALWRSAQYPGSAPDQAVWGQAFGLALEQLGMATFPSMPLRFIGPVLMHAGIPAYCLGDYFQLLLERRRRDPGMDAESFLAWATSPRRESRLFELDVPARRFITSGGDYAHDVVDRSLDLLERLSEPDPDLSGIRLPAYMLDAAQDELGAGRLDLSVVHRRAATAAVDRRPRPYIGLDPFGEGVQVVLPAISEAPDGVARWRVTADGQMATVQSRALWVGTGEAAPTTSYPLSRPVRTVLVSLASTDLAAELHVIDSADPILFFGDDGHLLAGSQSLPRGRVWIMHPRDHELSFTGNLVEVAEPMVPFGWDGWRLRLVELDDVRAISLCGGPSHQIHGQSRPRLLLTAPVSGVTTPYGSPVYAEPPSIRLPGSSDTLVCWHVDIRPATGGPTVASLDVTGPTDADPWFSLQRPILGAFDLTVRGPLGRGMRRTVFVAEGLRVSYRHGVRALSATGLRPSEAALTAAIGATVLPPTLMFGAGEHAHMAEYRVADETEPIVVTPPHAALLCPGVDPSGWRASPLHIATEAFRDAGRLLIRLPDVEDAAELDVWVGGERLQSIPPSGQQAPGVAGYELARGVDTIAEHGRAELVVPFGDVSMPVAFVRPRSVTSGVDLHGTELRLRDYRHVDGLLAGIYLVFAPWRHPVILPVSGDGAVCLTDELCRGGPFRVMFRVDDPWTTSSWPSWPGSDSFLCETTGIPAGADVEEQLLSWFLVGVRELPEPVTHPDRLWQLVLLADDLVRSGAREDLAECCGEALRSQPGSALLSLLDADLDRRFSIRALIVTGMAAFLPWTWPDVAAAVPPDRSLDLGKAGQLWAALPTAAAILTSDLLLSGNAAADGPLAILTGDAVAQCGETLHRLLKGGADLSAAVGRFGPDTEMMSRLSQEQVEAIWQAAVVVPGGLLDADTRMTAARQLFDARRSPEIRRVAKEATSVVRMAEGLIRQTECPWLIRQVQERRHPDGRGGWLAVPAASAAFALAARLAARGDRSCRSYERTWRHLWADLASQAPDLVGIDLVLAEVLVSVAYAPASRAEESG